MKSLVLKRDVSEMYKEYAENHKIRFPDLPHMKESLFCEIARHVEKYNLLELELII